MYIREESECCERICCGPNRSLTLHVHEGHDQTGNTIGKIHKTFGCSSCCCLRPSFVVTDGLDNRIGEIEDPCRCCVLDQQVKNVNGDTEFTASGACCQLGFCCPCIWDPRFAILDMNQTEVGAITKRFGGCGECMSGANNFDLLFPAGADETQKMLLLAVTMGLDLAYFERQKGDSS